MPLGNLIPDKTLLKTVIQRLARSGAGSLSRVTATVRSGEVTMNGTIGYEHERRNILKAASGVSGVRRVIDQIRVEAKKRT
jgi:osmotically-inducible protein OsmY